MNYVKQWWLSSCLSVFLAIGIVAQPKAPTIWKHKDAQVLWLSRDGSVLVSEAPALEPAHQIRIWDVEGHQFAGDLPLDKNESGSVLAISDDGRHLVVRRELSDAHHATGASLVRCEVWSLGSGGVSTKLLWKVVIREQEPVVGATFQGANVVLLWPVSTETLDMNGRVLQRVTLKVMNDLSDIANGALSPDGRFAVLSYGTAGQIFNARSGQAICALQPLPGVLSFPADLEFSYDGRTVTGTSGEWTDPGLSEDVHAELITDRWVWDVKSGKILAHWDNTGTFRPPFSPDGHALLRRDSSWEFTDLKAGKGRDPLQFEDLVTHKRAAFQIPHPWGKNDHRWLLDVRVSGDGKVVAALDDKGNIWLQNSRR